MPDFGKIAIGCSGRRSGDGAGAGGMLR